LNNAPQVAKNTLRDHGPSQVAWLQYNENGMIESVQTKLPKCNLYNSVLLSQMADRESKVQNQSDQQLHTIQFHSLKTRTY